MHKPVISLTLAYIVGLLLGHGFLYFPCSIAVLAVLFILTAGLLTRLDKLTFRHALHIVIPAVIGITAYIFSAAWFPANHYIRVVPADKTLREMTGTIVFRLTAILTGPALSWSSAKSTARRSKAPCASA
jgi:hypothetical protein